MLCAHVPQVPKEQVYDNLIEYRQVPAGVDLYSSVEVCADAYEACKG